MAGMRRGDIIYHIVEKTCRLCYFQNKRLIDRGPEKVPGAVERKENETDDRKMRSPRLRCGKVHGIYDIQREMSDLTLAIDTCSLGSCLDYTLIGMVWTEQTA